MATADSTRRQTVRATLTGTRQIERPAPLRLAVYEALVELIIDGSLQPGQHLAESELADHLGVSRQPVREALQRLQTEGWVDLRPAQGAFVHTPTEGEVDQLLAVRALLETESARLAALHAGPADVDRLWELQRDGELALASDDVERLVAANTTLHAFIVSLSGNAVLAELLSLVERRMRWYYRPIARPRGKDAWREHAQMIRAIAANDEAKAVEIMTRHTARTREAYHHEKSTTA